MDSNVYVRGEERIHVEVAQDHQVPIEVVADLHTALRRGWKPRMTHPLRRICIDLMWHRARGTIT